MARKPQGIMGEPLKQESPCGSGCPDFVAKTCPGEDPKCALFWRYSQGLR